MRPIFPTARALVRALAAALAVAVALALPAAALTPLNQEKHINDSLLAAQVGDMIRKSCPTISPRWFTVWSKARDLEAYARKLGYSEAEVKAFLKDKDEKARIRQTALDYMAARGVVAGDADSYCRLGREEIAARSLIGSLLREN